MYAISSRIIRNWRLVRATCSNVIFALKFEMVLRRDLVVEEKFMPKQLRSAAVQTETVQLTEATTQTKAAMNLLALLPPLFWPGKCSVVPRAASSPPDFRSMRDSVPRIVTYPERFENCCGIAIDGFSTRAAAAARTAAASSGSTRRTESGLLTLQGGLQQQHILQQHMPQQTAAAAYAAAASSGNTRRISRRPVDFCTRSSRWRDAKGRYCRAPSPATGM
jgi:surface antigen